MTRLRRPTATGRRWTGRPVQLRSGGGCWTGDRVYQGSAGKLVAAFLKEEKLTAQEREELRKLLDDMEV